MLFPLCLPCSTGLRQGYVDILGRPSLGFQYLPNLLGVHGLTQLTLDVLDQRIGDHGSILGYSLRLPH
ncbi:UNVERIFIED_CONTAM: hypothetical protein ITI15_24035, partial [Salmonella enterica subsp. enterica serovar Weltevreden]